jgi:hypothetical protein
MIVIITFLQALSILKNLLLMVNSTTMTMAKVVAVMEEENLKDNSLLKG